MSNHLTLDSDLKWSAFSKVTVASCTCENPNLLFTSHIKCFNMLKLCNTYTPWAALDFLLHMDAQKLKTCIHLRNLISSWSLLCLNIKLDANCTMCNYCAKLHLCKHLTVNERVSVKVFSHPDHFMACPWHQSRMKYNKNIILNILYLVILRMVWLS